MLNESKYKLVEASTNTTVSYSNTKLEFKGKFGTKDSEGNNLYVWKDNVIPTADYIEDKWTDVKEYRTVLDKSPVPYNNKLFDYDDDSRAKLDKARDALTSAKNKGLAMTSITWTCYDNTTYNLTLDDFDMLNLIIAQRSDKIHKQARLIYNYLMTFKDDESDATKTKIKDFDIATLFNTDLNAYA